MPVPTSAPDAPPLAPASVTANLVDLHHRRITSVTLTLRNGRIAAISEAIPPGAPPTTFVIPGFVDAHIHIESSMLIPTEFARLAMPHGTVATVSDPHEIANVLGVKGVHFMLDNAAKTPLKISFGAPPCVPATGFESAGATVSPEDVRELLKHERVRYLAEVMNYPGVIAGDADLLAKIGHAQAAGKPVDGHAPGLRGQGVPIYFQRGITTDHECFQLEEALEKLVAAPALNILIREGSAAKNFGALHPLLRTHAARVMFCSDDKHPNDLEEGHINAVVARAVALGYDLFDVLTAASLNPIRHYRLPVGMLRVGDAADFLEVSDLSTFKVLRTFIDGEVVAQQGESSLPRVTADERPNIFHAHPVDAEALAVKVTTSEQVARVNVIEAFDGQLVTARVTEPLPVKNGRVIATPERDLLKIVVVNRYTQATPAVAFIRGFKMVRGAIASSVAHDSHNIVAVGVDDVSLAKAINLVVKERGGLSLVDGEMTQALPLPVAGIMTDGDGYVVAEAYRQIDRAAKALAKGKGITSPFMTLSFMALLVIPNLKLSDKGLFNGEAFRFIDLVEK